MLIPSATDPVLRLAGSQDEDLGPPLRNTATATLVRTGGGLKRAPRRRSTSTAAWYPGTSPPSCSTNSRPFSPTTPTSRPFRPTRRPPAPKPDLELLPLLTSLLREEDPEGHPFPLVTAGMTDARHYDRLGLQTHGFLSMRLPPGSCPNCCTPPTHTTCRAWAPSRSDPTRRRPLRIVIAGRPHASSHLRLSAPGKPPHEARLPVSALEVSSRVGRPRCLRWPGPWRRPGPAAARCPSTIRPSGGATGS